ncbi:MAG: hypothetical protein Q8L39_15135 [Burkholderiales bacterium]|nr:hypothetical protein [Burkholderiales bacterium]
MSISLLSELDGKLIDGLQFCAMTYALFEQIRSTDSGPSRLRMRVTEVEKKLIEELLPICKYIQAKYRAGRFISVRWVNGSQQFDAEVVQAGFYVERGCFAASAYLEATCVMHPKDYLSRELLDTKGGAFGLDGIRRLKNGEIESNPVIHRNREFIQSYSKLVLKQIGKKASINYPPETTLIIQCALNTLYTPDEWEVLVAEVRNLQPEHQFREIFIFDTVTEYSCSL